MGFWFLLAWLDAGVPTSIMMYTQDQQRCLTVAQEHLEMQQMRQHTFIEVIYIGCTQGSQPRE